MLIEKIKNLSSKGLFDREIAEKLNLSFDTVRQYRYKNNIKSGRSFLNKYRNDKILKLHKEGLNISQISKKLNIPDSTVADLCKKMNLNPIWTKRSYYTDSDKIKGYMIRNSKFSSKRRNIEFSLDYTDIELPETCPLLETPLNYKGNFQDPFYPTLDRIDNSKGYIKGNVMVISRLANYMKNSANFDQLLIFCKNIKTIIKNRGALGNLIDIFPNIKLKISLILVSAPFRKFLF